MFRHILWCELEWLEIFISYEYIQVNITFIRTIIVILFDAYFILTCFFIRMYDRNIIVYR